MLALFPKVPKIQRPKALKIDVFDYPTVANIPIKLILRETRVTGRATSSPPIVWVYLRSNFPCRPRKTHVLCNGVRNGCSRSSKVIDFGTNQKRICNFLLLIDSNLGRILPRFRDIAGFLLRTATTHPYSP